MKPRRNKPYRPKPIRIPMTGLRDTIALHMHASLAGLEFGSDVESFNSLADIMNMVSVAIANQPKFAHEQRLIQGGVSAMNDVLRLLEGNVSVQERHIAPVRVAVTAIDCVLPWLDVGRLYTAEKLAVATGHARREEAAQQKVAP